MGKYLKEFELTSQYEEYINSTMALLPNVSLTNDDNMVHYNPKVSIKQNYLTIEALEDGLTASLSVNVCEYCVDEDGDWKTLSANTQTESINAGQTISFRGNFTPDLSGDVKGIGTFTISKKCNVLGNVMSMLFGDDGKDSLSLSGKGYAFYELFYNCNNIISAKDLYLPATTLANNCYYSMFNGCTSLTQAPAILPATMLTDSCYGNMFRKCSSLTTAPELPATTLAKTCYYQMFSMCTSLVAAPELPATALYENCYNTMFFNCTSLTIAPVLPATILAYYCYANMFSGCTSLTTAPELPATTLASWCYDSMFFNCTSLTQSPAILPATTLANYCYDSMFSGCTSLTTAPELPGTELVKGCYQYMFQDCSKLNYIIMLASKTSSFASLKECIQSWVDGVAAIGTLVKDPSLGLPSGVNGIPEGWKVNHIIPKECTSLTITAEDVVGNDTNTTIHYTAICNGIDYKGDTVTGIVEEGTAVSAAFPQNTSETETVERTITFEFMGATASTTITQGVWENKFYKVDLNNQWELSSTISNPDSTLYDGVYQSFSNIGVSNSAALMYIDIMGYSSFKFYVRSHAESTFDYVVVSNLDSTLDNGTTSGSAVKMTTSGKQNSGTSIDDYTLVEFDGIDENMHRIIVMYRKDTSSNSGDDRGYVLIPKDQ